MLKLVLVGFCLGRMDAINGKSLTLKFNKGCFRFHFTAFCVRTSSSFFQLFNDEGPHNIETSLH